METESPAGAASDGAVHVIVYVSSAVQLFSQGDLTDLLRRSRHRNREADISGILLYKDGNFMQMIEGPKIAVQQLMEKIKADPRHRGVIVLLEEDAPAREFAEWSMGFKKVAAGAGVELPGYVNFMELPLTDKQFLHNPSSAVQLLQHFRKILD